jgi:hypothetical protein
MNRPFGRGIRALCLATVACAAVVSTAFAAEPPSLAGVWLVNGDLSTIRSTDGRLPPMKPAARKRYDAAVAARKKGAAVGDTVARCLPHGLPRLLFAPYPVEILQEKKQITFLHEAHHMPRLVYLGEKLPAVETLDNNYMGASAGNWEGDTLVIDSAGFNDLTTIDTAGVPHSEGLTLQERMRLTDGGQTLEDLITVTDPDTFTRPWQTRITFKRLPANTWLKEFVCTDKNPDALPGH